MKNKLKPYIVVFLITSIILLIVWIGKQIFPFGENTIIYGDMYDQIIAFYYHFYDCFHSSSSLMIDFTTSGGINFFGILAYYILSPFSFVLLFFNRENLYLASSLIVALKIITASLTCFYSLQVLFKKKLSFILSLLLALSYAFSGYTLLMYQITPWLDAVYLFPMIVVGLKKVLDLENPYLYIGSLSISIICSFYVSYISLIFIFHLALFYIIFYQEKEKRKQSITALGITTVLGVGLSMTITYPSLLQVLSSARLHISIPDIMNSKLGILEDKFIFFLLTPFLIVPTILLIKNYRNNSKFLKWYLPSITLLFLPYIIEPINKIIHFTSYAAFPNRYGYMLFYLLVVGAGYYFSKETKENRKPNKSFKTIFVTIMTGITIVFLSSKNNSVFQEAISSLTFKSHLQVFWQASIISIVIIGSILWISKNKHKRKYFMIFIIVLLQITCNCFLSLGISSKQDKIRETYSVMHELKNYHRKNDYYRLKTNTSALITNNGMVTQFPNLDHFTSLVENNNLKTLKRMGYSSHWTKTYSKNGTLFTDSILANQYYLTVNPKGKELYQKLSSFKNYNLYKFQEDLSYGYFTKDVTKIEKEHSFDFQNEIYKAITNKKDPLFKIYKEYHSKNINVISKEKRTSYQIKDKSATNYLEMNIPTTEKSIVYLDIFNSLNNLEDSSIYKKMKIYVNDKLYKKEYPLTNNNGILEIGIFENTTVNIKIELLENLELSYLEVGVLPINNLLEFLQKEKVNNKVIFSKNQIRVEVDSNKEGIFFIPVTYSTGYTAKINNQNAEVISVYDNFLGVNLESGKNTIVFRYVSPGLKEGLIISAITLLILLFLITKNRYQQLIKSKILTTLAEWIYYILYFFMFNLIFLIPIIGFLLSYFFYIQ